MKIKKIFLILFGGYISILGFYFIWYYTEYNYLFFFSEPYLEYSLAEIAVVVFGITLLFYLLFSLILFIKLLRKPWPCFSLISIITLSTLLLIPSDYYAKYHENYFNWVKQKRFETIEKKRQQPIILKQKIEAKVNDPIAKDNAANRTITELQPKFKTESEENDKLRKQSKEETRESRSKDEIILALRSKSEEEHKTKRNVAVQAKSKKDFSRIKINSEVDNIKSDTKKQEIIFKVQIISSSTRLAKNSPQLKGIKNVWEYKHNNLYKYTVGNQKDLKSAYALQSALRRKGFNGAFVVTFKNGKRIPVKEALRLLN